MASLTLSQARSLTRIIAQDTSSTNPANSDSQVNECIELERQWYATEFPDEMVLVAGTVASLTSTGTLTTTQTFRSIDFAYHGTTGIALDREDYVRLSHKQFSDSVVGVSASVSTAFGAIRATGADNSWSVNVYPVSAVAFTATFWGHYEVVPLTGDSDSLLFGQNGSRTICILAALRLANNAGRSDSFKAGIAGMLPERIASRRADVARLLKPKPMVT